MSYPAHIKILQNGTEMVQTVAEHSKQTATYAQNCLASIGLGKAAYVAGMLHDMGKCTEKSRRYQENVTHGKSARRGSVIHTFQCCRFLLEEHKNSDIDFSDISREILAFASSAHHGLFDCYDSNKKSGFSHRLTKKDTDFEEAKRIFFKDCLTAREIQILFDEADQSLRPFYEKIRDMAHRNDGFYDDECSFYIGLVIRMLLSTVIEGDRRSTAEFLNETEFTSFLDNMKPIWEKALKHAEEKLGTLPQSSPIELARKRISDRCKEEAERLSPGIYRLNVPTGAGKTLSSLRFALAHAAKYNKRRIIFTAPLLTIIEQNASILRDYIGDNGIILEHHSDVLRDSEDDNQLNGMDLLMENWNVPVIITTMVQFLNTLFSGKTSSIRRFWSLCDSVIVVDEVQTVPNNMLTLFNLTMNFLSELCGATIVFCSATQPCLEKTSHPLLKKPKDIVPFDAELWQAFRRTKLIVAQPRKLEDIPKFVLNEIQKAKSLLLVCNTKSEAETLFRQISKSHQNCFHLSASMCTAHRKKTLEALKEALLISNCGGLRTICISTQVIEAGVDISFERVIRLTAGMDSVIQSAGRCNRNGESQDLSPVYILDCLGEKLEKLKDISDAKTASLMLFDTFSHESEKYGNDLSSDKAISLYYSKLYNLMDDYFQDYPIQNYPSLFSMLSNNESWANEDSEDVEKFYLKQAFKTAGKLFEVFGEQTETVVVPFLEGKDLIKELTENDLATDYGELARWLDKAKSYTVSIYDYQKKKLEEQCALREENGILVLQNTDYYDESVGLTIQDKFGFCEV